MKTVAVSKLKASLSQYLDQVRSGTEVTVTDHGVPIAKLVPVPSSDENGWLTDLERRGYVRLPQRKLAQRFYSKDPEITNTGERLHDLLKKERLEGW